MRLGSDGNRIAVHYRRYFLHRAHAQDRHLRLVDYGCREYAPEAAEVGDRESATLYLIRLQLPGASTGCEIDNRALKPRDVLLIRIPNHRDDQAAFECDGDADVDVSVLNDVLPVDGSVEDREGTNRLGGCGRDKWK